MVGDLAYSSVRNSGENWLDGIPEHWKLRRTKTLLVPRVDKGHPHEPLLAATQTKGVVRKDQYENRTVLPMKDLHLLKLVNVGDFVISLRSFQGGIEYARERGIISPAYTILYPAKPSHHGYLARLFKSAPYVHNLTLFVTGIRQGQNIDYERLSRSRLPLPPLAEQRAIVCFLDHTDRRIQRYIRAKERLIELLEEQKQAIIHQAVTGQIDVRTGQPYPAYKDSGVEWLGEVPEHWEIPRLGALLTERGEQNSDGDIDEVLSVLRDRGVIPYSEKGNIGNKKSEDTTRYKIVRPDDIVVNSMNVIIGSVGLSRYTGCLSPVYYVLMRRSACDHPRYLDACFQAKQFQRNLIRLGNGILAHRMRIPMELLKCEPLPRPPRTEQVAIVRFLNGEGVRIANAIAHTRRQIDLLSEYRTRLIADVVTGKLDVREVTAPLPDPGPIATDGTVNDARASGAEPETGPTPPHP